MKISDHLHSEWAFSIQDFGDARTTPDKGLYVPAREPPAFHMIENGFNGIRQRNSVMFFLIGFYDANRETPRARISASNRPMISNTWFLVSNTMRVNLSYLRRKVKFGKRNPRRARPEEPSLPIDITPSRSLLVYRNHVGITGFCTLFR